MINYDQKRSCKSQLLNWATVPTYNNPANIRKNKASKIQGLKFLNVNVRGIKSLDKRAMFQV